MYRGFYFGMYDTLRVMIPANQSAASVLFWKFAAATAVSTSAACISYPFYTVTMHLMMQSGRNREDVMYNGIADCWKKIYRNEGIAGFYRGVLVSLVKGSGGIFMLLAYDMYRHN